ncbi:fimbrial biogenesis chaperone [Sphingomonas paeninsulae]|jgi:fimbrial chaperone protein|nr:fimbria/pilus periplasmic chaperone [Sphingomonas paeninsulae]
MRAQKSICAAAVAALLMPATVQAASLKVYPVRVVLTANEPVQTMKIQNGEAAPVRVQLRVFSWHQENGKDLFEETRDVLANPGLFEIAAGGEQIARFGLRTNLGAAEKSYRVFLEEIPDSRPSEPGKVRTLLRISIPIFASVPNAAGRLNWRTWASGPGTQTFSVVNQGTAHVQINRLAIMRADGMKLGASDLSAYLLPGASQKITVKIDAPVHPGELVKLNAVTDQGTLTDVLTNEAGPHEADHL